MKNYDLVVIGAGPGGYVAAIRAAQLGMNVACVDENAALGGTCLRVGCIPSKALLESSERFAEVRESMGKHGVEVGDVRLDLGQMMKRKEQVVASLTKGVQALFKKNKVTHQQGRGRLGDKAGRVVVHGENGEEEIGAKHIVIATGSKPAGLRGVETDGERIGDSTAALSYTRVPEHLVVIGAGYIGLELGSVWHRLGAQVTVLEYLDRVLPLMDAELSREARKVFTRQGLEFRLSSKVTGARAKGRRCVVEIEGAEPIECDRVLVATGRVPNTDGLGLEAAGVTLNDRGFILVDERYATSVEDVFAIGDVIGGAMLAHKAEDEGIACVENLAGQSSQVNYDAIPSVVYTEPEIASVGRTEEQLQADGIEYRKGVFDFRGNGRARALGRTTGKVKMLADASTDRLLGVHIIGPRAGDLIAEAAVAIEFGASSEDIALCCHAHPTLAETLKEAALAVDGRALHA